TILGSGRGGRIRSYNGLRSIWGLSLSGSRGKSEGGWAIGFWRVAGVWCDRSYNHFLSTSDRCTPEIAHALQLSLAVN
ncbi:MAG TPA: hypothetical protein VK211_26480, partial [Kamptonema sp.]|nr:hypothetical protein [Kamptonema sp.]